MNSLHQENGLWPQDNLGTPKTIQVALGNQSHKARQVFLQRHFPLDISSWVALGVTWVALASDLNSFKSNLGGFGSDLYFL